MQNLVLVTTEWEDLKLHCRKIKSKSGYAWECFGDAPRDPRTGKRKLIKRRAKTQKEAKNRLEKAIKKLEQQIYPELLNENMTFGQLSRKWLDIYAATGVKRGSIRIREKEINILNNYFQYLLVTEITHHMYQNMLIKLDKEGYARNTISGVNTCANMIFKYAIKNKLINENPREDAFIPKKAVTVKQLEEKTIEETYFEKQELLTFLDAVLKIGLELDKERFYTLAFSGVRPGELTALKKSDIDFDNNTIRVSKTLYNENNNTKKYTLGTTKTNKIRVIDMDEKIMIMLKKLVQKNDKHKLKYQTMVDDFHDENFLFQRSNGYPFTVKNLGDRMRRIMKYIDIGKKLTPHSFRHSHISMMTESGIDLPTIMQRVGHEDPDTTLKVYTHVTEKMKVKSMDNLSMMNRDLLENLSL